MNRHATSLRMRRVDDGLHRLEGNGLRRLDALEAAARTEDFHPVRSGGETRFGLLSKRARIGWTAASGGQSLAGDEHPRSNHLPHVDQVAHGVIDFVAGAYIANRCHAVPERTTCVLCREP